MTMPLPAFAPMWSNAGMNAAYFVMLGVAAVTIVAFYATSFRATRSFSPARGKRSRTARRVMLLVVSGLLFALYAWLLRRLLS